MNGRIAVLCPTRDRPESLNRLIGSILGTSKRADVLFYADDDQVEDYRDASKVDRQRVREWFGPRIGPAPAANMLVKKHPDYAIYGLITDDSVVTTPGWDDWILETINRFPRQICVVSPHHNQGDHVDMPFVTSEWIKAVGWFCCPTMYHYAWPTVTSLIGEMTAIVHAPRQRFNIDHDYVDGTYQERRIKDNTEFYDFVSLKLPPIVEAVRKAMS